MAVNSISILRDKKLKVTPQRVSILNALRSGGHFTGEEVHNKIKKKEPGISISTVYNTLDTFERAGILNSFEANGMKWYEARIESHVNIYCTNENKIIDLDLDLTNLLTELRNKGINAAKVTVVAYSECVSHKRKRDVGRE